MAKQILFSKEAREKMLEGVDILVEAVGSTLSPKGQNVAIEKEFDYPQVIHDGVTVAKEIELEDKFQNMGVQIVKQAAIRTNEVTGDGTTTSTILAGHMIREGFEAIEEGANSADIRKGMEEGLQKVVEYLDTVAVPIDEKDTKKVEEIAIVSAQDPLIGSKVAEAVNKVGKDGVVMVQESPIIDIEVEFKDGMRLDRGYASAGFATNPDTLEAEMFDAHIVICDFPVNDKYEVFHVMELLMKQKESGLVLIADKVQGEAFQVMLVNKLKGAFNSLIIKSPGFGPGRKKWLADIAAITGATVISEEEGRNLKSVTLEDIGMVKRIHSTEKDTTIVGSVDRSVVEDRIKVVRKELEQTTEEWEKDRINERLARLTGGVAVINVGGPTQVEMNERKERALDAVPATQAAIEEGIVEGGEVILIKAGQKALLPLLTSEQSDRQRGLHILMNSLNAPFTRLLMNAGIMSEARIHEIVDDIIKGKIANAGFDVMDGQVKDMLVAGIIDPKKVVKNALINAVSVANMLMTTNTTIVNLPKKEIVQ